MAEERKDLRVKKTQRALVMAMLSLLDKQSFSKISVNDICCAAMVSRSTFYAHFEDKYDLIKFSLDYLNSSIFDKSVSSNLYDEIFNLLEQIESNVKLFRNLLMCDLNPELIELIRRFFHSSFEKILKEHKIQHSQLPGPADVISTYYAAGIASSIIYWISRNMPYSKKEMADCLVALLPSGPWSIN